MTRIRLFCFKIEKPNLEKSLPLDLGNFGLLLAIEKNIGLLLLRRGDKPVNIRWNKQGAAPLPFFDRPGRLRGLESRIFPFKLV